MSQATLSDRPYVNSNLFSGHYLDERVREREEWDCDEEAEEAMNRLQSLYDLEGELVEGYGEDALIDNWIEEVLDVLGFGSQQEVTLPGGGGYIDGLLFETPAARRDAAKVYLDTEDTIDLFERGVGLVEAKQWDADFTVRFSEQRPYRNASHQIKHYLENTPEEIQWGILTNGRKWRLYGTKDYETQTYYEVDLPELLERGDLDVFKYFYVFFRPGAFREAGGATFLDEVWSESETAAQDLGEDLQDNVFTALRVLGRGFVETNDLAIDPDDQEALDELKEQSLVLLYRLMFVLYAEARGLIHPENPDAIDEYEENFSLDALRLEIHDEIGEVDEGFDDEFSTHSTAMWSRLEDLFRLIDAGEESLGIPPYNGGLFDHDEHAFLTKNEVSNRYLAEVIYRLSTTENGDGRYVLADYADLDTRHLGSVYEGLLEHQFQIAPEQYAAVAEDGGQVWKPATEVTVADAVETVPEDGLYVVNDEGERKATGAYYTPDYVVTYIVEETVEPLVEEIREDLMDQGFEPGSQEYLGPFLRRVTELKILDPAMGSGHFLTKATGYLAEQVMEEVREVEEVLPVAFDEQHVRREIAKECIYGVDLNGMAVELAKLSMWLETLSEDRPLAFLDHHFKEGNSLVGSDIESIDELESDANGDDQQASLAEFGATREGTIERLMDIYSEFLAIENETVEDVREMKRRYAELEQDELRRRLIAITNVHTAEAFDLNVPTGGYERMATALEKDSEWNAVEGSDWFRTAQSIAKEQEFFHWKLEFPEVFYREDGQRRDDEGFDVVIGNPPWVSNWELTESHPISPRTYERMYPEAATGHWDLFVIFSYQAIQLTRDQGYHSFITPSSIRTEKYARSIRRYIVENTNLEILVDFGERDVFRGVDRQCVIYTCSPAPDRISQTAIVQYDGFEFESVFGLDQSTFTEYKNCAFRIDLSPQDMRIKETIEDTSIPLGTICCVNPGVVAHSGSHSSMEFDKEDVIYQTKEDEDFKRYLEGGDIQRYSLRWDGKYIDYISKKDHFHRPKYPELFESPKVIFRRVSGENNRLISCYDYDEYYTSQRAAHAVNWRPEIEEHRSPADYDAINNAEKYDIRFICALSNSSVVGYYFDKFLATGTLQGSYTDVYPEDIRQLPIREIPLDNIREIPEKENQINTNNVHDADVSDLDLGDCYYYTSILANEMKGIKHQRNEINLSLLDYFGSYSEGDTLSTIGISQPAEGVNDSILTLTSEEHPDLRIGEVDIFRELPGTVEIRLTARYKPDDEDAHETDRWGYTETDPIPAMRLTDLTKTEADLIEAFVPVAVEEAGGFANFRETATKTNSLVDRLEALTLPDPDDVADDLQRYMDAVERAEELDKKIEETDALIDEIVYELYGLTEEEIEIVEEAVNG